MIYGIDNLEATAQAVFQEQFASYYGLSELPEGWKIANLENLCTVKGGKRLPADCELLDTPTNHPYIRVRDVGNNRYVCLTHQFQYIDEETHSATVAGKARFTKNMILEDMAYDKRRKKLT